MILVFLFNVFFDGYRIFDYAFRNYSVQKMTITNSSRNSSAKRKSLTIEGNVGDRKVYFSRFDDNINELFNLYPFLPSKIGNAPMINIIKFKHSNKVILLDDDEFVQWKKHLLISSLYVFFSIMFFLFSYVKIKKKQ